MKIFVILTFLAGFAIADSSVGCGLGTLFFRDNSLVSATSRSITNATFSSQLFGITSGTSGCSRHSIVMNDKAPLMFAETSLASIKVDMAMGDGEYLRAFVSTLGCKNLDQSMFPTMFKNNFDRIFPNDNIKPHEMLKNVSSVINEHEDSKGKCEYLFT